MNGGNRGKAYQKRFLHELKRYITTSKISHVTLLFLILFLLFHYFTDHFFKLPVSSLKPEDNSPDSSYKFRDLKYIDELKRIKKSVSSELRDLENKRNQIQNDISNRQNSLSSMETLVKNKQSELDRLKREILQIKIERREAAKPKMPAPARLLASDDDNIYIPPPKYANTCGMDSCFDFARCSLTSQFPVYIYPSESREAENSPFQVTSYIAKAVQHALSGELLLTKDPNVACLYVVILGEVENAASIYSPAVVDSTAATEWLRSLPYWRGDGRNHLLVFLSRQTTVQNPLQSVDIGRAMVAQSNFDRDQFRYGFDVVLPTLASSGAGYQTAVSEQEFDHPALEQWKENDETWSFDELPQQVPAMRKYLLSFQGQLSDDDSDELDSITNNERMKVEKEVLPSKFHQIFVDSLNQLKSGKSSVDFHIDLSCPIGRSLVRGGRSEWSLCGSFTNRMSFLSHSTYTLVPPPLPNAHDHTIVSAVFLRRLAEALRSGAIPVIPGKLELLPFNEYIDWEKVAIIIPMARVTEIPFLLTNLKHADVLAMRRQGRFIFETYFSSTKEIMTSLLALIRSRLQIPPLPVEDAQSILVQHGSFTIEKHEPAPGDAKAEFGFPPPESKIDSKKFRHNFTRVLMDSRESWNTIPGPFNLYPHLPSDRLVSTDEQFIGSRNDFRPIGGGEGGTGRVFQESLGGNFPREQFTIVMLTYERDDVLLQAIERLNDLPHLNKVVVVWNSPAPPDENMRWPDIGVEVAIVNTDKNSLNNRFVPWDVIDTEAVLSIDDDAHLRHDEILFGFRVWRQNRNQVVGFPGRFHAWDEKGGNWAYNSNHTCELSMVLTGAAFFHKFYMYLYTYWMPAVIRDMVDEMMNCEDIAMNFLVSHVTRQPPVKVTSRWTFRCPGCPVALSQSDEHFLERHKCINKFVKIFGYMPLSYTQYRVDSILFKTRLPHDKQKCFKFI